MAYVARWRALRVNPNRIDIAAAERDVLRYVDAFLQRRIAWLAQYPPRPSHSSYVRTGALGRGWRVNVVRGITAVNGYIYNVASDRKSGRRYMTYVQGPWQTADHMQTGWRTVQQGRDATQGAYVRNLQAIYKKHIRKGP